MDRTSQKPKSDPQPRRRRKTQFGVYFVALPHHMLESRAYKELPPSAAKLYSYFVKKVSFKPAYADPLRYSQVIIYTYSEAERVNGLGRSTFSMCLKDLVRLGFIDPVEKGGLRGSGLSSNRFKLSRRWEKYGTPEFIEIRWESFKNGR